MIQKRVVSDPDDYRIYSNLRRRLQGSLVNKNGQDFVENDGSKRYRISAHPDFITYDKKKLLNHPGLSREESCWETAQAVKGYCFLSDLRPYCDQGSAKRTKIDEDRHK